MVHRIIRETVSKGEKNESEREGEGEGGRKKKRAIGNPSREFSPLLLQGGKDIAHAHSTYLEGKENGMCFGAQTDCC